MNTEEKLKHALRSLKAISTHLKLSFKNKTKIDHSLLLDVADKALLISGK